MDRNNEDVLRGEIGEINAIPTAQKTEHNFRLRFVAAILSLEVNPSFHTFSSDIIISTFAS